MIGGTDVVFWVHEDLPAADVILRTVRRHWPHYVFQNADDPDWAPRDPLGSRLPEPKGREFFVYRDEKAAVHWDKYGAVPKNKNTMLYVILGIRKKPEARLRSLIIVCGDLSEEMKAILNEIENVFRDATLSMRNIPESGA